MSINLTVTTMSGITLTVNQSNQVSLTVANSVTGQIPYSKYYRIKLTPPNTIEEEIESGYSGTLSSAISGSVITITSTSNEFNDSFIVLGNAITTYKTGTTTLKIWLAPNWDTDFSYLIFEVYKR